MTHNEFQNRFTYMLVVAGVLLLIFAWCTICYIDKNIPVDVPMVFVEGGTFTMGCTAEQGDDCENDEKPAHQVTVGSFYIGKYEVTQAQWKAVMVSNPSRFKGDSLPVEQVSWNDVQEFISKLNTKTGKQYRLPTEAEWEFACRGGLQSARYKYSGSDSIGKVAWYHENTGKEPLDDEAWNHKALVFNKNRTHTVGTKSPNELGIYDMSGNVWEWCNDLYNPYTDQEQINSEGTTSGTYRVFRGGGWCDLAKYSRVSIRYYVIPDLRHNDLGFRLACDAE